MELEFILTRIKTLLAERNWTLRNLTKNTTLSYGLINSWFNKKKIKYPSLKSICEICDAFKISLSEFFIENKKDVEDKRSKIFSMLYEIDVSQLEVVESLVKAFIINKSS